MMACTGSTLRRGDACWTMSPSMDEREVYAPAVTQAAARVGGKEALATRLKAPASGIASWIAREDQPDATMLLKVLKIALDGDPQPG